MATVTKVTKSKPKKIKSKEERTDKYYCVRCNRSYVKQRRNFYSSPSNLFKGNNNYLPFCVHCIEELFEHYTEVLGSDKAAMKRLCMKFDLYWNINIFDSVKSKSEKDNSFVATYIARTNLQPHSGKTFDDTLDEEAFAGTSEVFIPKELLDDDADEDDFIVSQETVDFWGSGLPPSYYIELEKRFAYWRGGDTRKTAEEFDESDRATIALIKQICNLEVSITKDLALGKSVEKSTNALNTLIGSLNLKPVQKSKAEGLDANAEMTPFGCWIRKIEDERPISEPDPEFKDVDGIIKYISVWFLGHMCKMLKINNKYSHLYEEELAKLRVERPEYEDEDETTILEDIFERANAAEAAELDGEGDE